MPCNCDVLGTGELWYHSLCPQGGEGGPPQSHPHSSPVEDSTSHLSSTGHITRSPARNPLSFRIMQAKVTLLDGSLFTCTVEVRQFLDGCRQVRQVFVCLFKVTCGVSETSSWPAAVWASLWTHQPAGERLLCVVLQRCWQQQGICLLYRLPVCVLTSLSV